MLSAQNAGNNKSAPKQDWTPQYRASRKATLMTDELNGNFPLSKVKKLLELEF